MVVAPLIRDGKTIGVLAVLDRRDGGPYLREDLGKVALFADLAVVALDLDTFPLSSSGGRTLLPGASAGTAHRLRSRSSLPAADAARILVVRVRRPPPASEAVAEPAGRDSWRAGSAGMRRGPGAAH